MNKEQNQTVDTEIKDMMLALERKKFLAGLNPTSEILHKNYFEGKQILAQKQINFIKKQIDA